MTSRPVAVLIGPMGAGKTRVGKRVAKLLGTGFVDTDKAIVAAHGPITGIFDEHGEQYFRALEPDAVAAALETDGVVSLGGGAVLDPETQRRLADRRVVFLTVSADAVEARLSGGTRPLARGGVADWERIFEQRRPIYEQLATVTFDTSRRPYARIAEEVAEWLKTT
jgi:shikimate kinase